MTIHCYAQRLLNPFRGMVNVIEYQSAEAVTIDGEHWDIYVRNDELLDGLDPAQVIQTSEIRYGKWTARDGLKRGPIYPSDDFRRLEHIGYRVYEHLLQVHRQIPFALQDNYELWLLDNRQHPLALIDSLLSPPGTRSSGRAVWRAGVTARNRFKPDKLVDCLPADCDNAADYLDQYINQCSGALPCAQWFHRQQDRSGVGLKGINIEQALLERTLAADMFPVMLLQARIHDSRHRALVEAYLSWQAPWLLVLQDLDPALRQNLEQQARSQALLVDQQHRFYPQVLDPDFIKSARVEAMLRRRAAPPPAGQEVMSTSSIELNEANKGFP